MKLRKSMVAGVLGLGASGALLAIAVTAIPAIAPAAIGQVAPDHPGRGVYQKACAMPATTIPAPRAPPPSLPSSRCPPPASTR
jgi:hypothetical protein